MRTDMKRRGLMLILSSPSGTGKTTLARALLSEDSDLSLSVSVTTRLPRSGECDGVDYHFVSTAAFEAMRADGALLESAHVFDHYYGTPRAPAMDVLGSGRDMVFDIDWQGTQQLRTQAEGDIVRLFVLPPSVRELNRRLVSRRQDTMEMVTSRMSKARTEISHYAEYDYVIINDDTASSVQAIKMILAAERMRATRQTGLSSFVQTLYDELDVREA